MIEDYLLEIRLIDGNRLFVKERYLTGILRTVDGKHAVMINGLPNLFFIDEDTAKTLYYKYEIEDISENITTFLEADDILQQANQQEVEDDSEVEEEPQDG